MSEEKKIEKVENTDRKKPEIFGRYHRPKGDQRKFQEDYFEIIEKDQYIKDGDGPEDFHIEKKKEVKKTNIDKFINSYADDAGIMNTLKKIAEGDNSGLVNRLHRDTTKDPASLADIPSIEEAFEAIDKELRGDLSKEDFIKSLTEDKINAYIEKKVNEKLNAQTPASEAPKGE